MRAAWCTVLVAIRIASSPSRASIGLPLLVLRARRGKFCWSHRFRCGCRPATYGGCRRGRSSPDRRGPVRADAAPPPDRGTSRARRRPSAASRPRPASASISLATKSVSGQSDCTCNVTRTLPAIVRSAVSDLAAIDQAVIRQRLRRALIAAGRDRSACCARHRSGPGGAGRKRNCVARPPASSPRLPSPRR